ncbi:hypothetical protein vBAmePPT11V19_00082 [Alteromonas phage vB_AmeP_PT11-V19]|nr:hypothetical protein vBAmePPT11V19_00082 [Alteromonas phage vB_AmeP_PT11-V19]
MKELYYISCVYPYKEIPYRNLEGKIVVNDKPIISAIVNHLARESKENFSYEIREVRHKVIEHLPICGYEGVRIYYSDTDEGVTCPSCAKLISEQDGWLG